MLYLTRWRIQLAAGRLAAGAAPVSAVASEVGYESEAAFCRAFKKITGVTPAAWRSRQRPEADVRLSHGSDVQSDHGHVPMVPSLGRAVREAQVGAAAMRPGSFAGESNGLPDRFV